MANNIGWGECPAFCIKCLQASEFNVLILDDNTYKAKCPVCDEEYSGPMECVKCDSPIDDSAPIGSDLCSKCMKERAFGA